MSEFKNILIVRTDRIGDVVLTTPSIRALHDAFPEARISLLVAPLTRDLVDGLEGVDEVLVDDRKGEHRGLNGYRTLIRQLKNREYDLAVVYHTKKRTNLLCALAGIPRRIGYKNDKLGILLTDRLIDQRYEGEKHEAQYCLSVLAPLGVLTDDLTTKIALQSQAEQWAEQRIKSLNISGKPLLVALHPGASCPTKRWPIDRFTRLARLMQENFPVTLVLIGGKDETWSAEDFVQQCPREVIDLKGQTSVAQMASLLKRCSLLVSNDSGPVHVAAAEETPVVSIFTRDQPGINPTRWRPLSQNSRVIAPKGQASMDFSQGEVRDPSFLQEIEVKEVFEAVDAILKAC